MKRRSHGSNPATYTMSLVPSPRLNSDMIRQNSIKGKGKEQILPESSSLEVMETAFLNIERDPETGRKMINQYLVLQELGHGTHGRVRLGRDMSREGSSTDLTDEPLYYAIKIVDRNPKKKRLAGFSRAKAGREGGKLLNENEIRKEIAIFKKVNHPNVVRMKEIIDAPDSSKIFMILEYCEGGELRWKTDEGAPCLTVDETRRIFRDTLLGLEYLHHQGIIHRDIKPSNLLFFGDTVKISDFGCSHYSEALRVASAQGDGDGYVDDLELAKTAGSPAFFAPEMCYSGELDLPAFTLRPPSLVGEPETKPSRSDPLVLSQHTTPLKPSTSNDSGLSKRPTLPRAPITNAIDVWALGVTLYCLLFGSTPFDAPNEYLLMQVIPTADFEIPPVMGSERLLCDSKEGQEGISLLQALLEKDPSKRIALDKVKRHPFTLRGVSDPSAWLASTDPHAQSFVTVSNDEVAAVVVKYRIKERVRQSIRSISSKLLQPLAGRHRSRSIGDTDPPDSPPSAVPRRRSVLGARQDESRSFHVNRGATLLAPDTASETIVPRERSTSNASSSGFGLSGKLIRMISRTSSQRSRLRRQGDSGDLDEAGLAERLSLDDDPPERFGNWESRMKRPESARGVQEEVDWDEAISDEEEYAVRAVTAPATPIPHRRSPSSSSSRLSHSPLRPMHIDRSPLRPEEPEEDEGLAFSIGSKRGRRASVLDRGIK